MYIIHRLNDEAVGGDVHPEDSEITKMIGSCFEVAVLRDEQGLDVIVQALEAVLIEAGRQMRPSKRARGEALARSRSAA